MSQSSVQERVAAVNGRVDVVELVGSALGWSRGRKRGKCPFHGSKSDSLAVYPGAGGTGGHARCWGCGWSGDAFDFLRDQHGLGFVDALDELEGRLGLREARPGSVLAARPVHREKVAAEWRGPAVVGSSVVAEHLWPLGTADYDALRVWLRARRVPEAMLGDHWLGGLRFAPAAPISAWPVGKDAEAVHHAPAMLGLIRRVVEEGDARVMRPIGVHATFLSPGLKAKMNRKRASGAALPARKMFGESSCGFVLLGAYRRDCPLFVGEGIETVLSGMALAGAGEDACGLAVLSLDNLQGKGGGAVLRAVGKLRGVLPLFDVRPDPAKTAVCFAHDGPVTGLIDADMAALEGWKNARTGELVPPPVQERPGGPVVRRAISSAERSSICAALFVARWRAAGCRRVTAIRPRMGMDFNDLARESV